MQNKINLSFSKKEVSLILKTGNRLRSQLFDIIFAPKIQTNARILIITSRKIGNAPARNKLRRRLKSIFYEEKLYNLANDYIFIAKLGSTRLSFDQLKDLLLGVVKK